MGLLKGPMTYRRFRVHGEPPARSTGELVHDYLEAIERHAFGELDLDGDEDRTAGWVCPGDAADVEFAPEKIVAGHLLVLGMRIDALRIPGGALRLALARAEAEFAEATGRKRLNRADREEVKERVVRALRRRVLPDVKLYEMVWDVRRGQVRLMTHNRAATEDFLGLFYDTFGLRLEPWNPWVAATAAGLDEPALERLLELRPAAFGGPHSA